VEIRDLVATLRQRPHDRAELAALSGFGQRKLTQLVTLLEEVGAVLPDPDGRLFSPDDAPLPTEAARLALAEVERHQTVQRTRGDMMRQFAESRTCRGQALLAYFGDRVGGPNGHCGHCDNCADHNRADHNRADTDAPVRRTHAPASKGPTSKGPAPKPAPEPRTSQPERHAAAVPAQKSPTTDAPYPLYATVKHRSWGTGTVLGYEADKMTVLFDTVGYKTLSVAVVRRGRILELAPQDRTLG